MVVSTSRSTRARGTVVPRSDDAFSRPGSGRLDQRGVQRDRERDRRPFRSHRVERLRAPGVAGSAFGIELDDAYLLRNGNLMVADIWNCCAPVRGHAKGALERMRSATRAAIYDLLRGLCRRTAQRRSPTAGVLVTEIGDGVHRLSRTDGGPTPSGLRPPDRWTTRNSCPTGTSVVVSNTPGRVDELTPTG